jgi:hypothetical protein
MGARAPGTTVVIVWAETTMPPRKELDDNSKRQKKEVHVMAACESCFHIIMMNGMNETIFACVCYQSSPSRFLSDHSTSEPTDRSQLSLVVLRNERRLLLNIRAADERKAFALSSIGCRSKAKNVCHSAQARFGIRCDCHTQDSNDESDWFTLCRTGNQADFKTR